MRPPRRGLDLVLATIALVLIGALEARESARQIADLSGSLRVTGAGAGVTTLGVGASAAVYVVLGWRRNDAVALRAGALVGLAAGLIGGVVRSLLIAQVVSDAVGRYAAVPDWFVPAALAAFVVVSMAVSAVGGAVLCFAGVRLARASRGGSPRPPA